MRFTLQLSGKGKEEIERARTQYHWSSCDKRRIGMPFGQKRPFQIFSVFLKVPLKNSVEGNLFAGRTSSHFVKLWVWTGKRSSI
jgi:hypothetical protein